MPERRPASDDTVLMRWMRTEVAKINECIVTERKSLDQLLHEEKPATRTKNGNEYFFNVEVLRLFREKLSADLRYELKLPMIFFSNPSVPDSCYTNDPHALQALQALGDLSGMRRMQHGKLWVGRAIAYSIMKKYPTAVQIAMG